MTGLKSRIAGRVHIIGAGLLGASLGLALRAKNVHITLSDLSPSALELAIDYGAGAAAKASDPPPEIVVVATPPDQIADTVAQALTNYPQAVVTDLGSVKIAPLKKLEALQLDLTRYVGSHPMAGREKGGAIMARADLFVARPWVICRDAQTPAQALNLVEALALEVGAVPVEWHPGAHDAAVAAVSHVPQLIASLLAAQLTKTESDYLALAGGGLRDTTRIAAGDPSLWVQILSANSAEITQLLTAIHKDLGKIISALEDTTKPGAKKQLAQLLAAGNAGVSRLPGKHGRAHKYAQLNVIIADKPGQLAALFSDIDELKINMEDMRLEHSPGAAIGFIELSVLPEQLERATDGLTDRGWRIL